MVANLHMSGWREYNEIIAYQKGSKLLALTEGFAGIGPHQPAVWCDLVGTQQLCCFFRSCMESVGIGGLL